MLETLYKLIAKYSIMIDGSQLNVV